MTHINEITLKHLDVKLLLHIYIESNIEAVQSYSEFKLKLITNTALGQKFCSHNIQRTEVMLFAEDSSIYQKLTNAISNITFMNYVTPRDLIKCFVMGRVKHAIILYE